MKQQTTRIQARQQTQTQPSQRKLSVTGRSNIQVEAPDHRMMQTAQALDQLVGGVSDAVGGYYAKKAKEDFDVGVQKSQMGQEADGENVDELKGHAFFSSTANGITEAKGFEQLVEGVDIAEPETWGGHESPQDATKAILQARMQEVTNGMPDEYKGRFLKPLVNRMSILTSKKQEEYHTHHKEKQSAYTKEITTHELGVLVDSEGVTPENVRAIVNKIRNTPNEFLSKDESTASIVEALGQYAIDIRRADVISKVIDTPDKDGISLGKTKYGDALRRDLTEATRLSDAEFDIESVKTTKLVKDMVNDGTLSVDVVQEIGSNVPELYSNEQWGALLVRSDYNHQKTALVKEKVAIDTSLYRNKTLSGIADGAEKNKIIEAGHNEVRELGELKGWTEEQILSQQVLYLSGNGGISKEFESIISNGAIVQGEDFNAEPPEAFLKAFATYEKLFVENPQIALRHLTNKDAKANILRFQAAKDGNRTDQEAYALVLQTMQNPLLSEKSYAASGKRQELINKITVTTLHEGDAWFSFIDSYAYGLDNLPVLEEYAINQAESYVKIGISTDKALMMAQATIKENWQIYNNRAVFTGGQQLPSDWGKFETYIKETAGLDDDTFIEPIKGRGGVIGIYQGVGIWTGQTFSLAEEYTKYKTKDDPTLDDAETALLRKRLDLVLQQYRLENLNNPFKENEGHAVLNAL